MKNLFKFFLILFVFVFFSSCQTVNKKIDESAKKEVIRLSLLRAGLSFNRLSHLFSGLPDISNSTTFSNLEIHSKLTPKLHQKQDLQVTPEYASSLFNFDFGTISLNKIY